MNDQTFELLNEKINKVESKVDDVAKDVKEMLAFKWQIIGGTMVVSAIIGIVIQVLLALINNKP